MAFFGEGATNQGAFHESLNLAALWQLPVLFVCEDNKYAISVEKTESTSVEWNADRASAYGMPGVLVKENDAVAVYEAAGEAIARARRGGGPTLLEVKTDRYLGHFQGDPEVYRTKGETTTLRANDPIPRIAEQLRAAGELTDAVEQQIRQRVSARVAEAYEYGRASPYPKPEDALLHVFN